MYHVAKAIVCIQFIFGCKGCNKFVEIGVKPHNIVESCYVPFIIAVVMYTELESQNAS
jgi:hypothetical protein